MISKQTISSLNLKLYTKTGCHDLFSEILNNYKSMNEFETELKTVQEDPEKLNKIWWVLNYHSQSMDHTRKLRAFVESKLDNMVDMS